MSDSVSVDLGLRSRTDRAPDSGSSGRNVKGTIATVVHQLANESSAI